MILPVNADANLKVMLLSREFGLQVYSEVKGRLVVSIMQFFNKLARLMNGSRAVIRQIDSRAQPLEIGGFAAVNRRADQSGGENVVAAHPWPLDRSGEFNGRFSLQKSVDIAQVLAKEVVKFLVISGGVFRSVPPAPVAAFGNPEFLARQRNAVRVQVGSAGLLCEEVARVAQQIPGFVIFVRSDPDVKVGINPGAWHKAGQRVGRSCGQNLRRRQRLNVGRRSKQTVESLQKFTTIAGIIFPGVFTIQDDSDHRGLVARAARRHADAMDQVARGGLRVHAGIDKTNQVRKLMVAEEEINRLASCLVAMRLVEQTPILNRPIVVAMKVRMH